jgi:hypothetical protein
MSEREHATRMNLKFPPESAFIDQASKEFNMEPPLCEHTIRKCIEALPDCVGEDDCGNPAYEFDSRHALESLLPKKPETAADEDRKCGNCAWYKNAGDSGTCKRYAPRNCRNEHPEYAKWPWVSYGDLCGEWQP